MELQSIIKSKREELQRIIEKKEELETEIEELEKKVIIKRESPKYMNPTTCLNPPKFISRNCMECHFYEGCTYYRKNNYDKKTPRRQPE